MGSACGNECPRRPETCTLAPGHEAVVHENGVLQWGPTRWTPLLPVDRPQCGECGRKVDEASVNMGRDGYNGVTFLFHCHGKWQYVTYPYINYSDDLDIGGFLTVFARLFPRVAEPGETR